MGSALSSLATSYKQQLQTFLPQVRWHHSMRTLHMRLLATTSLLPAAILFAAINIPLPPGHGRPVLALFAIAVAALLAELAALLPDATAVPANTRAPSRHDRS
jgi:hypothetical protein